MKGHSGNTVEGLFLYNQRDYQQFEESYDIVPYRRMGIAGRASYTYDNRYIAEFISVITDQKILPKDIASDFSRP